MKKYWDIITDNLGRTIFHPQFFLKNYEYMAIKIAKKYARGTLVDIGCGRQPYKKDLVNYLDKYIGVDHPQVSKKYHGEEKPDILADATNIPLPGNYADIVLMISVLEHLPDPVRALKEAFRLTKKGGHLIAITIQNYRLHDIPFDFFRYTEFGLKQILISSGFKVRKVIPLGNYLTLTLQLFNVYILYEIKKVLDKEPPFKFAGYLLLMLALPVCFLSNLLALVGLKIFGEKNDASFAIYNLAVSEKI